MFETIVQRHLRVPRVDAPLGGAAVVARQMDAALLQAGFSASRELMDFVAGLEPGAAIDLAARTVSAVRGMVGDHVRHNAYFIDFPHNVPDTMEFWVGCLREALVPVGALADGVSAEELRAVVQSPGFNLLDLPTYGRYQHSYAELAAAHDDLIASAGDRITVLHLGDSLEEETRALYLELAGATTPLGEADLALLRELADRCLGGPQPEKVPVRENRALINRVRLVEGWPLLVDTVTDVLRLAAAASDGDVSLQTLTKFRNFKRRERRLLLAALDRVVSENPSKLADVARFAERWKRLAKALHPNDYPQYSGARAVFDVASGEKHVRSLASQSEEAIRSGDRIGAARVLSKAPGALLRSVDRLLRGADSAEVDAIVTAVRTAVPAASGRVLLSLLEHLLNRSSPDVARVFVGRSKRAWVTDDVRAPIPEDVANRLAYVIEEEIRKRLPKFDRVLVDPEALDVALPLSGKASEAGFAVLPRGSRTSLDLTHGDSLRFFTYWREAERRTDFDLSALMLDENFEHLGQVSWTNLRAGEAVHSGDITQSRDGATEFIEVPLRSIAAGARYVVPQVNIYSGEGFDEVAESMFGYMLRSHEQKGLPFEARTVRTRSEMRGGGRVALPVMFERGNDGEWSAVWTHLYLSGSAQFNRVEGNRLSTALLARSIVERHYLTVEYLASMLVASSGSWRLWGEFDRKLDEPVTFIGLQRPDGLPEGSQFFGPENLSGLIPG